MSTYGSVPITLFGATSTDAQAVAIALHELGLEFNVKFVDLFKQEQKEDWYLKINPTGKIPLLQDLNKSEVYHSETMAILLYLARHYDAGHQISYDYSTQPELYQKQLQWLSFATGNLAPIQAQVFLYLFTKKDEAEHVLEHYRDETRRFYTVLENHLEGREWVVGDHYSIADIKLQCSTRITPMGGILDKDFTGFPNLKAWLERCIARPAFGQAKVSLPIGI